MCLKVGKKQIALFMQWNTILQLKDFTVILGGRGGVRKGRKRKQTENDKDVLHMH